MNRIAFTLAAAAVAIFSTTSSAQSAKAISLGVSLGAAIPTGELGEDFSTGYNGTASLMFNSRGTPLGIRIDGMYNKFSVRDDRIGGPLDDISISSANANLVYALPGVGIRPYLIGGGGIYGTKVEGFDSETDFGVNGGVGASFQLSGFTTFVEARYHHIFTEPFKTNFVPVTFGITL